MLGYASEIKGKGMFEELTVAQAEELKGLLITLKAELEDLLALSKEATKTVELDQPIGRVSRIDAIQQQKMASTNRSNAKIRLLQTKAALAAFEIDEYGDCKQCEEPIGYERLKARPEAPLCLTCQSRVEARR